MNGQGKRVTPSEKKGKKESAKLEKNEFVRIDQLSNLFGCEESDADA